MILAAWVNLDLAFGCLTGLFLAFLLLGLGYAFGRAVAERDFRARRDDREELL